MPKVLVLFAHPRLEKSRSNRILLRHLPREEDITFRDLYELYPDFNVNVAAEQAALLAHDVVVLHHPMYWYSAPPLVKQWIDLVLAFGWAYGPGGTALKGKTAFHVVTTGGPEAAYQLDGFHGFTLAEFLRPLQRTMTLCGMTWLPPFAVHGTHRKTNAELEAAGAHYARLLGGLSAGTLRVEDLKTLKLLNDAIPALQAER
jgi:glutathione-regulated potassium-efflux system ancillary protein KefG